MNWNKFFRTTWRLNALLIASAGGLSIFVLLYALYAIFKSELSPIQVSDVVNVAQDEAIEEEFVVGSVSGIGTSEILLVSWVSEQNYRGSYSEKEATSTRNLLFLNPVSGSQRWLFPTNDALILTSCVLTDAPQLSSPVMDITQPCNQPGKPVAILYQVVKKDTNGDGRLGWSDAQTLALSKPDGSGYVEVFPNLDGVLGQKTMGDRQLFVLLKQQQNQQVTWAILGLDDFQVKEQKPISLPQASPEKP